jgi:hypothetical protein
MEESESNTSKKNAKKSAKRKRTDSEAFVSDLNEDPLSNILFEKGLKSIQNHAAAVNLISKTPNTKKVVDVGDKKAKAVKRKHADVENGESKVKSDEMSEDAKKARAKLMVDDLENVIKISFNGEVPDEIKQKKEPLTESESNGDEWTAQDITELMVKMEKQLPSLDVHNAAYRQERLDWSLIASEKHSAESCKRQWEAISSRVMKNRTLSELVAATRKHIFTGDNMLKTHRSFPKKPILPFMTFFIKNRDKIAAQNPELGSQQLAQFAAKEYEKLSERKREKYKRKYQKAIEDYNSTVETLRRDNPLLNVHSIPVPTRPLSAQERYVTHMIEKRAHKHPDWDQEQLQEHFRSKWEGLDDDKKRKLEEVASAEHEQYALDLYDFFNKLFSEKLSRKSRLTGPLVLSSIATLYHNGQTKSQRKQEVAKLWKTLPKDKKKPLMKLASYYNKVLKKSRDGQQREKPPASAYNLFVSEFVPTLVDVPSLEKMKLAALKWKSMPELDRNEFKRKAAKLKKKQEKSLKKQSESEKA